jgi:ATP-dependent DNA helicase PIF1
MPLNEEQTAALRQIQDGHNIFLTGPAGSGKSFLIAAVVEWTASIEKPIALTAMTGCAALLLGHGAKTLHSWAGIGLGRESVESLVANILKNPKRKQKWKRTDILVIDEISMMTPELFEKLDTIGKKVRCNSKPFGGIQVVLCGDFFQLPPVVRGLSGEVVGRFAFESPQWNETRLKPVILTRIVRQTDAEFQQLLNECRIGRPSEASIASLQRRRGLDWKSSLIRPTILLSRNTSVDQINEKNIQALNKPLITYTAITEVRGCPAGEDIPTGETLQRYVDRLDNDSNYAQTLTLCVGCQVMLLVNMDVSRGLVNGSRGVVVEFAHDNTPIVQFLRGDPIPIPRHEWVSNDAPTVARQQIPLRVAYALTIHKSQGATLDCALIDIGTNTFECGQAYVALSRVRNMESLYVWNVDPTRIRAHSAVVRFYERLGEAPEPAVPPHDIPSRHSEMPRTTDSEWNAVLTAWSTTASGEACLAWVDERRRIATVYPPTNAIFHALDLTPLAAVRVVLLGQDPYHGPGQAHGLSFSVSSGTPLPPSLKNIRKECIADLGRSESDWSITDGDLSRWARQGVLLLNTILTVEEGNPASHDTCGWNTLTRKLLEAVVNTKRPVVFLAWGKHAQQTIQTLVLHETQTVLSAVHPSPLSAHRGFFGSKPFSQTNTYLEGHGLEPIRWI